MTDGNGRTTWVLDTGPLSHFARAGWLGALKAVLAGGRALIPDTVEQELYDGVATRPYLQAVLDAEWIEVVALDTADHLTALAFYAGRLVGSDGRNLGEAGVLALAEVEDATAIVDDRVAVNAAHGRSVRVRRTLGLLCEALRSGLLTLALVSAIADDLLVHEYRLPFEIGGFAEWATREGLVPPADT